MIIEDNEDALYLLTFIFKKHGYDVVQTRDGREEIELAGRVALAVILLDIQLPVLDGYAVAWQLLLVGIETVEAVEGGTAESSARGVLVKPAGQADQVKIGL